MLLAAALAMTMALPPTSAHAGPRIDARTFATLAATCAPHVDRVTLEALVRTESAYNPYAIGVVGTRLARQPATLEEAVATAHALERQGYNFSVGLGQVNRYNLARFGETIESAFDACRNLRAGSTLLAECFSRSLPRYGDPQQALRAALSCYYSGNFETGFRHGYVQKVVANAAEVPAIAPDPGGAGQWQWRRRAGSAQCAAGAASSTQDVVGECLYRPEQPAGHDHRLQPRRRGIVPALHGAAALSPRQPLHQIRLSRPAI
jgi:type IV secretion system protein VirB1